MGRSVSYPSRAEQVIYVDASELQDADDFQWAIEEFQQEGVRKFPSMSKCNTWVGREDHALLENKVAYLGVSEYCGLVSVWVVAKDDRYGNCQPLAGHWASKINLDRLATCFGYKLNHQGTMSNGEGVFSRANTTHATL